MRRRLRIAGLLFTLLSIFSGTLFAKNDLQTAFEKVKRGYETVRYHAIVMDTMAVSHRMGQHRSPDKLRYRIEKWEVWYDGPDRLRLVRFPGRHARKLIIIKNGKTFYTKIRDFWVARPVPQREKDRIREFPIRVRGKSYLKLVEKNYTIQLRPDGTLANRAADILSILPNYPGRLIWKIWLDARTGIILRQVQQIETPRGLKTIKAKRVIAIDFPKSFQDSLFVVSGRVVEKKGAMGWRRKRHFKGMGSVFRRLENLAKAAPYPIYLPRPLPKGFAFIEGRFTRHHNMAMIQSHFSDGMIDFSIFQIEASNHMAKRFLDRMRRHHPPENRRPPMEVIPFERDGFTFLIMGNVPAPWLQRLTRRLQPLPKK
ncbi:MAG: hypothetical protein GXO76_04380 [Calditrichaeota bacterium]|nr:hypothetical protein [Calditrichota bacterium]